jgi:hypothetical protein
VRPLIAVYWLRFGLGIVSGVISTLWGIATGTVNGGGDISFFLNGLTVALLIYLISYYAIRARFAEKIEKKSKIMTTGIGIYFFTWIVTWVLFFSLARGQPPV